ncbi:MAG: hypothetical protein GXO78_09995 [Calditrichaeota bacterium]|nr:hypothetical protein [Calditrichota bacterium]
MCRLLVVKSQRPFDIALHLQPFAQIARHSKEYQGHGWGCGYQVNGKWRWYRSIVPIWEDDLTQFGETHLLIAHARSAFRDQGIVVENNMPFFDGRYMFIFNGELRGVRIRETGRTGAEKIFRFLKRFNSGDLQLAIRKAVPIILKRTQYVRAMNFIIADDRHIHLVSYFNEDPDYFTLRLKRTSEQFILCSQAYPGETGWQPIPNATMEVY